MGLILITVDCLRLDDVPRLTLPHSHVLPCVSASPITPVASASILTALYPPRHGLRNLRGASLAEGVATLAVILSGAGWATRAAVGGKPLHHSTGLHRGFDVYDDEFPGPRRSCHEVAARMGPLADKAFVWLHLFDLHAPFPGVDGSIKGVLDARDAALGRVARCVEELAAAHPSSHLVVTADHGEGFCGRGEPDGWTWHGERLEDVDITVPLYLRGFRDCRPPWAVRSVDILPTVCRELALGAPPDTDGVAVQDQTEELWAYSESHLDPCRHYPHVRSIRRGLACLVVGDNYVTCRPTERQQEMLGLLRQVSAPPGEESRSEAAEKLLSDLRALGYL